MWAGQYLDTCAGTWVGTWGGWEGDVAIQVGTPGGLCQVGDGARGCWPDTTVEESGSVVPKRRRNSAPTHLLLHTRQSLGQVPPGSTRQVRWTLVPLVEGVIRLHQLRVLDDDSGVLYKPEQAPEICTISHQARC
ncbi:hypothetical protein CYMTET_52122 [Cymbomonas tetramitiformis]|uniref:Uncharacterized protein n=1 Tax=Cymbomonas tetramitiformis TaxID=36881 RepID=A0AAE0ERE5_9CHLO|nr:hypothetical protein CYMTET_52122 [Cymbomonas tetramitiformis]